MLRQIHIENYKSIETLSLELGRITVLIGENGSGKTNILEAIALTAAAANDKLDNEFLVPRGIRVTEPQFMRSGFAEERTKAEIVLAVSDGEQLGFSCVLQHQNSLYTNWYNTDKRILGAILIEQIHQKGFTLGLLREYLAGVFGKDFAGYRSIEADKLRISPLNLLPFLIYAPEQTALRNFAEEGQIQPLGIKGQGLFKLLTVLSLPENQPRLAELKARLQLLDWFSDFEIPQNLFGGERRITLTDRYVAETLTYFDQRSANEGFLFLLFYFALFVSDDTPSFFAIDNIETALNPKLCRQLIKELNELSQMYHKQAIFTTHNPAILDGLNLDDDEQRLYVVSRNLEGRTRVRRVQKPPSRDGQPPLRLSEAFLRGYIGGLPKGF